MTLDREFVLLYLSDQLAPALHDRDFGWLAGKNQFRRPHPEGFQNLILSASPYRDLMVIDAHFGLRHEAVEEIAGKFTRSLTGWRPEAHTLLISYGKLTGAPYRRFKAKDTDGLDDIATTLLNTWTTQALPFLETHHTLPQIDHLLNDRPEEPTPSLHTQVHRCLRGLTVAWLTGRPGFEQLAETYASFLQHQATKPQRAQYQQLRTYLQAQRPG